MLEQEIVVYSEEGLHARPAALFVQTANQFVSDIRVANVTTGSGAVDAKSILGVLTLGVHKTHTVRLSADGTDAELAMAALLDLVESNFAVPVE